ncbi:HAD family hydrolase [Arthrobacter sp. 35W]|uniref:HAD family hydrolase n=1 Tax=Arthrobacter sp. 35W TaxID=1132441 RepID=UPI0003FB4595|nr:HAD hydrolase-like protein [Arthrobacter sp. 35W]
MMDGSLADTMVMFDWNGTIVLDADRAHGALNAVLHKRALPTLDGEQFTARFKLPMAEMFAALGVDGTELATAEDEWNGSMSSATTRLRSGVATSLPTLSEEGAWLGVVSAASATAVAFDQRTLAVPAVWQVVEAPIADKLSQLSSRRGQRARAFYVGDTAYDMQCAAAAGYTAIGVANGYAAVRTLWDAGAEHVVESLEDVASIVRDRSTP